MSEAHDLFVSYRRKDGENVEALVVALQEKGLRVWLDRNEIADAASIQRRIDEGLSGSRALVAWYTVDYPKSRACQWELTAALIAAGAETAPVRRLLIVNPEENTSHIAPVSVRDLQHFSFEGDYQALAQRIADVIRPISGTLGTLRRLTKPDWFGLRGLGSNRFVGRVTDLWKIHTALCAGNFAIVSGMPAPAAAGELVQIRGSGGIGKSLLAEEYALRFGAWWPAGVFWLRAYGNSDNPNEIEAELAVKRRLAYGSQFADFALQLGLDVRDKSDRELRAAIGRHLDQPYLWIVDDLPTCNRDELEKWLAPGSAGRNIITTRSRRLDALGEAIDLRLLVPDEARTLLTRDRPAQPEDKEALAAILEFLDGHALALDVARAACRRLGYGPFRSRLEHPDKDALALAAELAPELPNGHNPHIAATFLGSILHLGEYGRDVLRLAAQLAPAPIPVPLLEASLVEADQKDADAAKEVAALALQQALDHSLAEEAEGGAFTVHGLVFHTLRRSDNQPGRGETLRRAAMAALLDRMAEAAADIRSHVRLAPFIPHAQELARDAGDLISLYLAGWLGTYCSEAGFYQAAREWKEVAYHNQMALLGEDHPDTLSSMANLAETLRAQGDLGGARSLQEKVLEASRRLLGEDHLDTLSSMNNLAGTLHDQGDLAGARRLQEKVLEANRRLLGEDHPHTLLSIGNMAGTLFAQGDLAGAQNLLEMELEANRRLLGEEHPHTLLSMSNLAETLRAQGDLGGARSLQEKVLEASRRLLGEEHPGTSRSAWNLLWTMEKFGDTNAALALWKSDLLGLLKRDPNELGDTQRKIQEMVADLIKIG